MNITFVCTLGFILLIVWLHYVCAYLSVCLLVSIINCFLTVFETFVLRVGCFSMWILLFKFEYLLINIDDFYSVINQTKMDVRL